MKFVTPFVVVLGIFWASGALAAEPPCQVGVYRLADGALVDVGPTTQGLRWRTMDGVTGVVRPTPDGGVSPSTYGWTDRPDGVPIAFACPRGEITFKGQTGRKLAFEIVDTRFKGDGGVELAGRLVLPKGSGKVPVSVMVHGSESTSAIERQFEQRAWPAHGVGVFIYDKRGTGGSDGRYTQDFRMLARDAIAAAAEARRLTGSRLARIGFDGGSQGGWIAPLAASQTPVDFVLVRFGLAESALAEDRGEVMLGLKAKGWGPEVLAKAREITNATGRVIASNFTDGFQDLDAVRARYGQEPWFKDVQGEFSGRLLAAPEQALRIAGPFHDQGTSWDYDPMPTLTALKTPVLWILGSEDREAPVEETRRRLVALHDAGRPFEVLEFPGADHGIVEFETGADGKRINTRYSDGYFRAELDFIRTGRVTGPYGRAIHLTAPR